MAPDEITRPQREAPTGVWTGGRFERSLAKDAEACSHGPRTTRTPRQGVPLRVMARTESEPPRRNGKPANGAGPERPEEFDRFAALTDKLLLVPKKELDEKLKKAKR